MRTPPDASYQLFYNVRNLRVVFSFLFRKRIASQTFSSLFWKIRLLFLESSVSICGSPTRDTRKIPHRSQMNDLSAPLLPDLEAATAPEESPTLAAVPCAVCEEVHDSVLDDAESIEQSFCVAYFRQNFWLHALMWVFSLGYDMYSMVEGHVWLGVGRAQ